MQSLETGRMYLLLADAILVIHFLFIVFVAGGQVLIIIGYLRGWHWIRNLIFRTCHILGIAVVVAQAWADRWCFLTIWEGALRKRAGEQAYTDSFVQHWVGRLVFYDVAAWVFTLVYTLFAIVVILSWVWIRPLKGSVKQK